ncbi:hypothetical protein JCM8202_002262 [Rhodotorula sphaerocarpa]
MAMHSPPPPLASASRDGTPDDTAAADNAAANTANGRKRGRKQDDSLPPSRSRDIQRAFRARRAALLSNLEMRVAFLERENEALRTRFGVPPNAPPLSGPEPEYQRVDGVAEGIDGERHSPIAQSGTGNGSRRPRKRQASAKTATERAEAFDEAVLSRNGSLAPETNGSGAGAPTNGQASITGPGPANAPSPLATLAQAAGSAEWAHVLHHQHQHNHQQPYPTHAAHAPSVESWQHMPSPVPYAAAGSSPQTLGSAGPAYGQPSPVNGATPNGVTDTDMSAAAYGWSTAHAAQAQNGVFAYQPPPIQHHQQQHHHQVPPPAAPPPQRPPPHTAYPPAQQQHYPAQNGYHEHSASAPGTPAYPSQHYQQQQQQHPSPNYPNMPTPTVPYGSATSQGHAASPQAGTPVTSLFPPTPVSHTPGSAATSPAAGSLHHQQHSYAHEQHQQQQQLSQPQPHARMPSANGFHHRQPLAGDVSASPAYSATSPATASTAATPQTTTTPQTDASPQTPSSASSIAASALDAPREYLLRACGLSPKTVSRALAAGVGDADDEHRFAAFCAAVVEIAQRNPGPMKRIRLPRSDSGSSSSNGRPAYGAGRGKGVSADEMKALEWNSELCCGGLIDCSGEVFDNTPSYPTPSNGSGAHATPAGVAAGDGPSPADSAASPSAVPPFLPLRDAFSRLSRALRKAPIELAIALSTSTTTLGMSATPSESFAVVSVPGNREDGVKGTEELWVAERAVEAAIEAGTVTAPAAHNGAEGQRPAVARQPSTCQPRTGCC